MDDGTWKLIEQRLLEVLGDQAKSVDLGMDRRLVEDLGLGSLRTVELIIQLEEELDIGISDDELVGLVTLRDLRDLINIKLAAT
jgi:acyl carrier protein